MCFSIQNEVFFTHSTYKNLKWHYKRPYIIIHDKSHKQQTLLYQFRFRYKRYLMTIDYKKEMILSSIRDIYDKYSDLFFLYSIIKARIRYGIDFT